MCENMTLDEMVQKINNGDFSTIQVFLTHPYECEVYVIFETSKPIAKRISEDFLKKELGSRFNKLTVYPRRYKKHARELIKCGAIIKR